MIRKILAFILFFVVAVYAKADDDALRTWKVGEKVRCADVTNYGIEHCFTSETISDKVFSRMQGKTYKKNCTIKRDDLRYVKVLHYNLRGDILIGELVCNKDIAHDLVEIFRKLFDAKYPIERMKLIDDYDADDTKSMEANNTSCFNFRYVAGTNVMSNHSRGKAIDINPLYNPYVKKRSNGTLIVSPEKGRPYVDRSKKYKYKIEKGDLCYRLFIEHGFSWGGNWDTRKDYQHFEKP